MASLLSLPDELLCRIADHCIARPYDADFEMPSHERACGPSMPLLGLIQASKRLHRLLQGKLIHTFDFSVNAINAHGIARKMFTLRGLLDQLHPGSIRHTVLDWDEFDNDTDEGSLFDALMDWYDHPSLSTQTHWTLRGFNMQPQNWFTAEEVIPDKVKHITFMWSQSAYRLVH